MPNGRYQPQNAVADEISCVSLPAIFFDKKGTLSFLGEGADNIGQIPFVIT